jgi:hypothetical protein
MEIEMKINITFDLDLKNREIIANYYGYDKPASYMDCKTWIETVIETSLEEIGDYEDE